MAFNRIPKKRAGLLYALFYSGQFVLLGVQLPFFAGWLTLNGFRADEIGLLTGIALLARLAIGPFAAYWADHQDDERRALRIVSGGFALGALGLVALTGKAAIAASAFIVLLAFGLLVPLTDTAVLRADRNGWLNYGRTRASGSFAFLLTTIGGGVVLTALGLEAAAPAMALAALFAFLASWLLPPQAGDRGGAKPVSWREAPLLLRKPIFLFALAASGLIQGAHAVYYAFAYLQWHQLGYENITIGALWATGVCAEIVLLIGARRLVSRFPPAMLLVAGAVAAALRWTLTAMEPPLAALFLIQTLHALTFAAAYLGSIEFVDRAIPTRLVNTAMTLMSATGVGAVTGAATVIAGYLWSGASPGAAWLLMAAMGGIAAFLAMGIHRMWNGEKLFD